jgi:hypothetical protein
MFQFSDSESVEAGRDVHFHHGAEPGDRFDGRVETLTAAWIEPARSGDVTCDSPGTLSGERPGKEGRSRGISAGPGLLLVSDLLSRSRWFSWTGSGE